MLPEEFITSKNKEYEEEFLFLFFYFEDFKNKNPSLSTKDLHQQFHNKDTALKLKIEEELRRKEKEFFDQEEKRIREIMRMSDPCHSGFSGSRLGGC